MKYFLPIFFCFFFMISQGFAQENENRKISVSLHGYIKDLQGLTVTDHWDSLAYVNLLHNRINLKADLLKGWSARLEIRNRIYTGNLVSMVPGFGKMIDQYNGLVKLSGLLVDEPNLVIHSVIDRLLVQYESDKWDVRIGRQRINWGLNNIWNPNDIFNAYNFLDFDYEERPGNDAVRVTRHFKKGGSLDMAWKPGKNKREHIAAFLLSWNKNRYDYQLMAGRFLTDWVIGGGWAGSLGQTGFKGEMSYFHPSSHILDTSGVFSITLMIDRSFKNNWYASLSALYISKNNQSGSMGLPIAGNSLSAKELFPYPFTVAASINKSITPIHGLQCSIIYAPENNNLILFPSMNWNISQNFDIDITGQSFLTGQKGKTAMQGSAFYLRGKWSF